MSKQNIVDVEIFDEYYKLKGEATPEHMVRLARYVDQTMRKVVRRNPRLTLHKAAVLAAINIADELLRTLDSREEGHRDVEDDRHKEEENGSQLPEWPEQPEQVQSRKNKKKR